MKPDNARLRDLFQAVQGLDSPDECRRFFTDLCTPAELLAMADRWHVAKLLDGGMAYREIYEQSGVSTATVTRVARALTHGEGGYRSVIERNKRKVRGA